MLRWWLLLAGLAALAACGTDRPADDDADGDADADGDGDGDGDADADADADADGDGDGDTDADGDGDGDTDADTDADGDGDADADADGDADPDDLDRDGHRALEAGGDDCDDADRGVYPGAPDANWIAGERIAADELAGAPSLALDPDGVAHAAFIKLELLFGGGEPVDALRYARRDGVEDWFIETVEEWAGPPSLAIDPDGVVHIAYVTDAGLRHASGEGGAWELETVVADVARGFRPTLRVASDGTLHVAFVDDATHNLRLASFAGEWTIDSPDDSVYFGDPSLPPALALSASGAVHLAYIGDAGLRHADDAGGEWSLHDVDDLVFAPFVEAAHVELAVHGETPHITYASFGSPLDHATLAEDGTWTIERIPTDLTPEAMRGELAIDDTGAVHLVFHPGGETVWTLTNATVDGSYTIDWLSAYPAEHGFSFALHPTTGLGQLLYAGVTFDGSPLTTYQTYAPPNLADDDCNGEAW